MADDVAVRVENMAAFRRDVRAMDKEMSRELTRELKAAGEVVLPAARALAPRRTGRLAASLRSAAAGNKVSIRSRLPYANAVHWGTGARRGKPGPHNITPKKFVVRAVDANQDRIVEAMGDAFERFARKHGF